MVQWTKIENKNKRDILKKYKTLAIPDAFIFEVKLGIRGRKKKKMLMKFKK